MTLILALKCKAASLGEGILLSSDSKATTYGLAHKVQKIFPITLQKTPQRIFLALAAGAGYESMVRHAIRMAEKEFSILAEKKWKGMSPSFNQFEEAIEIIESKLITMITGWKKKDVVVNLNLILTGIDPNRKVSIYVFDNSGLATPVHDSQGFACIGSGFVTGGNMILNNFWRPNLSLVNAQTLAAYTIETVSQIDTSVGPFEGSSWLFRVEKGQPVAGQLLDKIKKNYSDKARKRDDAIKLVWNLSEQSNEDRVLSFLNSLKRKLEKEAAKT